MDYISSFIRQKIPKKDVDSLLGAATKNIKTTIIERNNVNIKE